MIRKFKLRIVKFLTLPYVKHLNPLSELDMEIILNPDRKVCPTCLSNCGQCGGNGHHVKLKDLKNHHDWKSGWTSAIGGMLNN